MRAALCRVPNTRPMSEEEVRGMFSTMLKNAREKAGLSQKQMAEKLDVTQPVINRFESGKANITVDTLNKYADALGCVIRVSIVKPRKNTEAGVVAGDENNE